MGAGDLKNSESEICVFIISIVISLTFIYTEISGFEVTKIPLRTVLLKNNSTLAQ